MRSSLLTLAVGLVTACASSPATTTSTAPLPPRGALTAAACEQQGGAVVGDIGDGAVHRADYRCPQSGLAPIGPIIAEPGGPLPVEGAVCCK
jgi:hypothetical protein